MPIRLVRSNADLNTLEAASSAPKVQAKRLQEYHKKNFKRIVLILSINRHIDALRTPDALFALHFCALKKNIEELIKVLESLILINGQLLSAPKEVGKLTRDKLFLQNLKEAYASDLETGERLSVLTSAVREYNIKKAPQSASQSFSKHFVYYNWYRLILIRLKRIFDVAITIMKTSPLAQTAGGFENSILNPILGYVAWAFYVPRFLMNLLIMSKHVICPDNSEKMLSWQQRLSAQWERRWFELLNDGVWCLVGLLNCFLLAPTPAMVLTVALYSFDVLMAYVKRQKELNKIVAFEQNLQQEIKFKEQQVGRILGITGFRAEPNETMEARVKRFLSSAILTKCDEAQKEQIADLMRGYEMRVQLRHHLAHTDKTTYLSLITTIALFAAMSLSGIALFVTLPAASISMAMTAAIVVVAVCIISKLYKASFDKLAPKIELMDNIEAWKHIILEATSESEGLGSPAVLVASSVPTVESPSLPVNPARTRLSLLATAPTHTNSPPGLQRSLSDGHTPIANSVTVSSHLKYH